MSSWRDVAAVATLLLSGSVLAQGAAYPGIGRAYPQSALSVLLRS